MLKRVAALLMILLFAGQALAGGIVCGIDAISSRFSQVDEAACSMQSMGECDEMACCLQGKSPTGSVVAMVCCEVKCGESTGGAQLNFAPQSPALAPPVITIRLVSLESFNAESSATVSFKWAESALLHHDPPDLFLSNSTFLI
ncbi:MAG: hypothetical protein AB7U82_14140 [Blastocatellales bacterium]